MTATVSHDELDAITSALVGTFHMAGLTESLGTENEPPLIIPKTDAVAMPLVVGVSGPIAAGKTTFAEELQALGFSYTRFSLVIDDMLRESGLELTRYNRQKLGHEINATGRQRWLAEKPYNVSPMDLRSWSMVCAFLRIMHILWNALEPVFITSTSRPLRM
ncbi:hypothetical protein DEA98_07735 [Brucella pseudogrignonensis]|nr:hypothetical protein [Brucella pseudogrignonensis]